MSKFAPGQSGNPKGRKLGSLNKRTRLAAILESHAPDLGAKVVELAMKGNMQALTLCLDKLLPKAMRLPLAVDIPQEINHTNLPEVKSKILSAVIEGKLSIDDAEKLIVLISPAGSSRPYVPTPEIPIDPIEAARMYREFIQNS